MEQSFTMFINYVTHTISVYPVDYNTITGLDEEKGESK
jgi:hypothetical protein